jgi:hypothetical protein
MDGSWELSKLNEDGVYEKAGELSKEEVIEVVVSHEVLQYDPDSEIGQEFNELNSIESSLVDKGIDKEGAHDVVLNLAAGETPDLSGLSQEDLELIKKILPGLLEETEYSDFNDDIKNYTFDKEAYEESEKTRKEENLKSNAGEVGMDPEAYELYRKKILESNKAL